MDLKYIDSCGKVLDADARQAAPREVIDHAAAGRSRSKILDSGAIAQVAELEVIVGNPVSIHRLLFADSESHGLLFGGEGIDDRIAVAVIVVEGPGSGSKVVGIAVGTVAVILAAVEVL